jgi:hypothetical protein
MLNEPLQNRRSHNKGQHIDDVETEREKNAKEGPRGGPEPGGVVTCERRHKGSSMIPKDPTDWRSDDAKNRHSSVDQQGIHFERRPL